MFRTIFAVISLSVAAAGCALDTFHKSEPGSPATRPRTGGATGSGPVLSSPPVVTAPGQESVIAAPSPTPLPRERPKAPAATLGPASKALVTQAQSQRKKGDFPGATASLERALRIEPGNPLLWIEMGRLRMDQRNYAQAEAMGRKALSMSVGDDRTQSLAWQLIADSYRARGQNVQAQEAQDKARVLSTQ